MTQVTFKTTIEISLSTPAAAQNKIRARWEQIVQKQREKEQCNNTGEMSLQAAPKHVIGISNEEIREAMRHGTIASTVADSGARQVLGQRTIPVSAREGHQPKSLYYKMGMLYRQRR